MLRFGIFGIAFGFVLSHSGATDYDSIANMFLMTDLRLAGVIAIAAAVAGASLRLIAYASGRGDTATPLRIQPKARQKGNITGGLLFGAGWAITGACPGTALVQVGEGKWMAFATLAGIFSGTALYRRLYQKRLA